MNDKEALSDFELHIQSNLEISGSNLTLVGQDAGWAVAHFYLVSNNTI